MHRRQPLALDDRQFLGCDQAVGSTEQLDRARSRRLKRCSTLLDLRCRGRCRQGGQVGMRPGVIPDLHPGGDLVAHKYGIRLRVFPDQEECRLRVGLVEESQNGRGVRGVGAVVERERNQSLARAHSADEGDGSVRLVAEGMSDLRDTSRQEDHSSERPGDPPRSRPSHNPYYHGSKRRPLQAGGFRRPSRNGPRLHRDDHFTSNDRKGYGDSTHARP
jgi:hypothetical protein